MPGHLRPRRTMNNQATDVATVVPGRHGHMNPWSRAAQQAMQFGGRLVAEHRTRPDAQDGRPELSHPRGLAAESGEYPGMDSLPGAAVQAGADSILGHAQPRQLAGGDHAGLISSHLLSGFGKVAHGGRFTRLPGPAPAEYRALWITGYKPLPLWTKPITLRSRRGRRSTRIRRREAPLHDHASFPVLGARK